MIRTNVFNAKEALLDRYERLKDRFIWALIDGFYVLDGDTVLVIRDVGDHRFSVVALRLIGVDSPEVHTSSALEREAGELVTEVSRRWCSDVARRSKMEVVEIPGGKYRGRALGDVVDRSTDKRLSDFLLEAKLVREYAGGTKPDWTDRQLRTISNRAKSVLRAMDTEPLDHSWVMPAIENFMEEYSREIHAKP